MRKEDLIAYARRDWAAIEASKRARWAAAKLTSEEALRIGDELRRHMLALHPERPTPDERTE